MSGPGNSGKMVGVCFLTFFAFVTVSMGFTALSWGAPVIFAIVPFGMAGFAVVMMIAVLRGGPRPPGPHSGADFVPPARQEPTVRYRPSPEQRKVVYQAPSECPKCGASLSSEKVDWVGPLQMVCPYCNATIDAVERSL